MVKQAGVIPLTAVIRVDAGIAIGAGHVVRCLALAVQLRALGWQVRFVCRAHEGHWGLQITELGFALVLLPRNPGPAAPPAEVRWLGTDWQRDALETAECLGRDAPAWLIVDHYGIDRRWEEFVAPHVGQILVIDDLANRSHIAALLVDQNLQSRPDRYDDRVPATCRKLLGPRYAMVHPKFAEQAARQTDRDGQVRRILACVGGVDPKNVLPTLVESWASLASPRPALDVVVGSCSPNLALLQHQCGAVSGCTLHVQSDRMAELMARADLMLCAAGTINWERCCLSLPAVLTQVASNQHENIRLLTRARTGLSIGDAEDLADFPLRNLLQRLVERPSLLRRLGRRGKRLVDGRGAYRVAIAMSADSVSLRRATNSDAEAAWHWRNSDSTRRYFTDPRPIPFEEHVSWWRRTLCADDRSLLIAEAERTPVGVVRLDHDDNVATLSIYLDPTLTALGLGAKIIDAARRWAKEHRAGLCRLRAVINAGNLPSRRAFAAAGFLPQGDQWVREV